MKFYQFLVGDANGKILLFTGYSTQPVQICNSQPLLSLFNWAVSGSIPEAIISMIFSSCGKYLITGNASGVISIFEQLKNPPSFQIQNQTCLRVSITGLDFNSAKKILLVSTCDHKARVFNFPSLELKKVFFHQQETYHCKVALVNFIFFVYLFYKLLIFLPFSLKVF